MADQRKRRQATLLAQLPEARVDGILISSLPNIRYLTGFSGSSALLIVTPRDATLITDFRYQTQVADEVGDAANVVIESESLWTSLWKQLGRAGIGVVGFESAHLSARDHQRLEEGGSRWQWRGLEEMVEGLRVRKDKEELENIAAAAKIATTALGSIVRSLKVGLTEFQVAGLLEKALRDAGSEGFPFATIVASGPRTALPHARTSSRQIAAGELLLVDFGAVYNGYCADVTRTFMLGSAGQREREVYALVRAANELASAGIRAGMKGREADAIARTHIEKAGYGPQFGHGLGHGIGLEVHEAPRLARSAEATVPPSSVVTVEPGIYIPGWGGVRIEDDVYLSTDGPKVLTHYTRDLVEIR